MNVYAVHGKIMEGHNIGEYAKLNQSVGKILVKGLTLINLRVKYWRMRWLSQC